MIRRYLETPSESLEACALIKWVNTQANIRDYFVHIPNEGKRSVVAGRLMVIMGLKRGVSDYFLAYPVNPFHGLWLELKRTGRRSRVSAEQLMWQERTRKVGYMSVTAYGWEQAKEFIEEYLRGQDGL